MTFIGTRICQRPRCGKRFDIGYGGGRAKYCPGCRDIVMAKRKRERVKEMRRKGDEENKKGQWHEILLSVSFSP